MGQLERPNVQAVEQRPVMAVIRDYPSLIGIINHRKWARKLLQEIADYHYPTFVHSIEVGRVAYALGEKMIERGKMSLIQQQEFALAGLLHDYGKTTLGERGLQMLNSTEATMPDNPDRLFARQHVRNGFEVIKNQAKRWGIPDRVGLHAAYIIAGHHEYQDNRYPRLTDDDSEGSTRRHASDDIKRMQRYLAGCDQAVGIAMAGKGGHGFIEENLSLEKIREKLIYGRDGKGPARFEDIVDDIIDILTELKIVV